KPIEASLIDAGVQLHTVRDAQLPTGTAFICLSDDAENAITVAPGANMALLPEHLPALDGVQWLPLQLETPLDSVLAYARAGRASTPESGCCCNTRSGWTACWRAPAARAVPV